MQKGFKNNITKIDTPFVRRKNQQQMDERTYRYHVHIRRAKIILGVFLVLFVTFAIQLWSAHRQLNKVHGNIAKADVTLRQKKAKNRELKSQEKKLHDPSYLQELVRAKYNYAKDGETVYNFVK